MEIDKLLQGKRDEILRIAAMRSPGVALRGCAISDPQ
jgi:hypothetical protein